MVVDRTHWLAEAFSLSALVKTWFSPFKQTYNGGPKGSIDLKFHAAVDNFVSRIIGGLSRTVLIFTSLLGMAIVFLFGIVMIILWPFIPLLPVIAVLLTIGGFGA